MFKVCNHKVSAGFAEFSGGANDRTSVQKERHDIQKLYTMIADMLNGYPSGIKNQVFCLRYYGKAFFFGRDLHTNDSILKLENTIFFEELVEHKEILFRIQHLALNVPTAVKLLLKFISQIPQLLAWRNAVINHIDQF